MPELIWPEKPTCHATDPVFRYADALVWRPAERTREPYGVAHRTCGYCGSIHPADLVAYLENSDLTVKLGGSDWKYGWPHKFYVRNVPNLLAGQMVKIGSTSLPTGKEPSGDDRARYTNWRQEARYGGMGWEADLLQPAPAFAHAKWYNEHLMDAGYSDAAWQLLADLLEQHAHIRFERESQEDGSFRVKYRAPYRGYQASVAEATH